MWGSIESILRTAFEMTDKFKKIAVADGSKLAKGSFAVLPCTSGYKESMREFGLKYINPVLNVLNRATEMPKELSDVPWAMHKNFLLTMRRFVVV